MIDREFVKTVPLLRNRTEIIRTRFEFRADGMLMEHISCETCDDLSNTMKVRVSKNKQARS